MGQTDETKPPTNGAAESVTPSPPKAAKARAKAQRVLPTDRIAIGKQVEILRAYGQIGASSGGRAVTNAEVAEMVGVHPSTAGLANAFFTDIGLLVRANDGQVPSADVTDFARAYQWDQETAPTKLAPALLKSWFGSAVVPKVQFRPYATRDVIGMIADAAGASAEHKGQIESLLELLKLSGLVQIEGDTVKAGQLSQETAMEDKPRRGESPGPGTPAIAPGAFQISMSVTMADIARLPPDKIAAFFAGIAEVMKIQSEIESKRIADSEGGSK